MKFHILELAASLGVGLELVADFVAHGNEGLDGTLDVIRGVRGGQLHADAREAAGHDGEAEADHVDTARKQTLRELTRQPGVLEQHRGNGAVLVAENVETGGQHLTAEMRHVAPQCLACLVAACGDLECLHGPSDHRGRHSVREKVRAALLTLQLHQGTRTAREAAGGTAERLAEGGVDDLHFVFNAEVVGSAATARTEVTRGMRVVNHDAAAVLFGECRDLVEGCNVTVHREDAVRHDQHVAAAVAVGGELGLKGSHVEVLVPLPHRLAEAHAVDDGGVVELVAHNHVLFGEEALEDAGVGVEARGVQDRVLLPQQLRDLTFVLLVQHRRAADEANARHAEACPGHGVAGSLDNLRAASKAEVVVGAEVEDLRVGRRRADGDALRGVDDALLLVGAGRTDI
eukprot:PhM_4_TR13537/c0_g1_i1/m.78788